MAARSSGFGNDRSADGGAASISQGVHRSVIVSGHNAHVYTGQCIALM